MTKKGINKKAVLGAVVFLVVIVVAAVFIQKWTEEGRRKDGWVKEYLWEANRYGADYAALPTEVLPWEEWYQTVMDGPKLTDGDVLPENRLGTLMHTYVSLSTIHLKEPDNAECQALFEKLRPYYEKAFVWEQEPGTEECLERLEELCEAETMAEIDTLAEQVQALYESTQTGTWLGTVSDSDLHKNP